MKKIFLLLILSLILGITYAQEENVRYHNPDEFKTIFGGKTLGGYGGLGVGYTIIQDRPGVVVDARGGVIIGHSFVLGIGGCGFLNSYEYLQADNADISLTGGYGGIVGEFILFPRSRVHVSFPVLAGIGAIASTSWMETGDTPYQNNIGQTSIFMIVEPAVELEFNFTRFFRMAGYFSYRYTTDIEMDEQYASPDALINYSIGMRVKFGKF
jgi:hypothetical protein